MKIDTILKEDRVFSKTELQNFEVETFTSIDSALTKIPSEDLSEVKTKSDELIKASEESVYGRYISGSIGLIRRPHEDNINMQNLLLTFYEVHNWKVVEFLSGKILNYSENKLALHCLADCYEERNCHEQVWAVYVRLVKADFEEIVITKKLADHYLEEGNKEEALTYYRRAMTRSINTKDSDMILALWKQLSELQSSDFGYFLGVAEKVNTHISAELATRLLEDLSLRAENIDRKIQILKKELEYDKQNCAARSKLISAYREKHAKSSRLETCLSKSGITNMDEDAIKAINLFETDIAFDTGSFVYQRSTNRLGVIRAISDKEVQIAFGKTETKMSADMAFKALEPLPKTNVRVLKSAVPQKFADKCKNDVTWALRTLMESNNNKISMKEIKSELSALMDEKDFDAFKRKAKKELMENPYFSAVSGESETYELRSTPITTEEKQLLLFKDKKDFYDKVKIAREFITNGYDTESESFAEIVNYFQLELKKVRNGVTDQVISSNLLLDQFQNQYKISSVSIDSQYSFEALYEKIDDKVGLFVKIDNAEIKKAYLEHLLDVDKNWPTVLKGCFPYYTYSFIPELLKSYGQGKVYIQILKDSVERYKEMPDVLIWNLKYASDKEWEKAGVSKEVLIRTQLLLRAETSQAVELKKDVTENRKRTQTIDQYLFTEKHLYQALEEGSEEFASGIYSIIASDRYLDKGKYIEVRHAIGERFPDFRFFDKEKPVDNSNLIPTGFLCTKAALDQKIKERDHIEHVELQEVASEIADARALGDLRENSEYQYGKDKQKNLNARLRTISDEIEKAQVITPAMVDPSKIAFGTEVELYDNNAGEKISYIILGQWESDPDKHILNFKTPLGNALMNKSEGEELKFEINGTQYDLTVKSIKVAEF